MRAYGALGAQPLLQKALFDSSFAAKSLLLIRKAVKEAEQIEDHDELSRELSRDLVQEVLWYALLKPGEAERVHARVAAQISKLEHEKTEISRDYYLVRCRWLGAYRLWLKTGHLPRSRNWTEWPLPLERDDLAWVRATALKYRGTLLAAAGERDQAVRDFNESVRLLCGSGTPLLRFIGGTAALQAAESLQTVRVPDAGYLKKALGVFRRFKAWGEGPVAGSQWLARVEGLRAGKPVRKLPDPQKIFLIELCHGTHRKSWC
jgi:hypothetical protein